MNNIPSLASVMFETAREVIKTETKIVGKNNTRNWAQIRTAKGDRSVSTNMNRMAQMSGGGLLNNTTTQPNFYSPFLTPTSFQIPNTRKEIYLWANWWRNNEPKVAAGINFYTNFPFNGWRLECKSSVIKDYFEKLIQKLNFQYWLPEISQCYHLYGDCFVLISIDCEKCKGQNFDMKTGQICDHKGASWKSIHILNPDSVMITPGFMDTAPTYAYLPNDREVRLVMERQPHEQDAYDSIPDDIKRLIVTKQPIKLNPISMYHFKHAADPWSDYGNSLVRPLFVTLAYKDKLRQAQWLIAERLILPIKIVTVGDENRPASQADLDSVQDQLAAVANDPNLTLVVPHAFDYKFVGASGNILQVSNEFELIDQEILDGLMLNKALLNGEGPAYGNAQVGLMSMNERLETWRRKIAQWIEEKIFKPCAEWNDFITTGEGGQDELIYPKIIFDDLKLKDNTGTLQVMQAAQQAGALSAQTLIEQLGLDWDQEVERLRFEQGMNFINSADVMNTDMNIGFGGVSGQGFTGGLNQPLTGGAEVPPTAAPAGGLPPAVATEPAQTTPAPTAESLYSQYKFASSLMNEISLNRKLLSSLDDNNYKNAVDEELNRKLVVSGRAHVGEIPENFEPDQPWDYIGVGVPSNYLAMKEVVASNKKQKQNIHGYNNLEKKLYKLIMSMNIPVAFYAQYEAGPSNNYILDGAFPSIKLGIEADGEIFHNSPEKIQKDRQRDINLSRQGWTILRFTDKEIEKQPKDVAMVIAQAFQKLLGAYNSNIV
jgi:hypothetical protein